MSPLPGKVTDLLSPCRLTGCRVTDKSSQDAAGTGRVFRRTHEGRSDPKSYLDSGLSQRRKP